MPTRYVNPVPGGRVGRTDMGVDISAPAGTPVRAIADETEVGILRGWYRGQPLVFFRQTGTNIYNYVAEQITNLRPVGTHFRAGDPVATVASSGTGLELGWATSTGRTRAQATTGYTEGQVTPAGSDYRRRVLGGGRAPGGGGNSGPASWLQQAGWSNRLIPIMLAIGGAESRWRIDAVSPQNDDGTYDYGWLQINSSHGFDRAKLLSDPVYTARAGLTVFRQQGLGAWSTYKNGAYRAFMGQRGPAGGGAPGRVRPGGEAPGGTGPETEMVGFWGDINPLNPHLPNPLEMFKGITKDVNSVADFVKMVAWIFHPLNILRAFEFLVGFPLIGVGLWILMDIWRGSDGEAPMRVIGGLAGGPEGAAAGAASSAARKSPPPVPVEA